MDRPTSIGHHVRAGANEIRVARRCRFYRASEQVSLIDRRHRRSTFLVRRAFRERASELAKGTGTSLALSAASMSATSKLSTVWVAAAFAIGRQLPSSAAFLLIIYPVWDAVADYVDATRTGGRTRNRTQAFVDCASFDGVTCRA